MENDILSALDWRVSCHTPMDFARYILELLPEQLPSYVSDTLLEDCQTYIDYAVTDVYFSCFTPSVVGSSCVASSLNNSNILSLPEKQAIWTRLSELCHFDLSTKEVVAVQQGLLQCVIPCKPNSISKLTKLSHSNTAGSAYSMDARSTLSPICVVKTARQA